MNISLLTMVGMVAVIAGNGLNYFLNREKITRPIGLLLGITTLGGLFMVGYSDYGLNEDIGQLQADAEGLRDNIAELSKPAVELVKGEQQLDPKDSLWYTVYNFRTNPALHARDVAVTITCSDSIVKANCTRESDKPGIGMSKTVQLNWVQKGVSFNFRVNFLAADETLRVVVVSRDSLGDPDCDIKTWSRSTPTSFSP